MIWRRTCVKFGTWLWIRYLKHCVHPSAPCPPSTYTLHVFSLQDVAVFLQEFKAPDILLGVIAKSHSPRLTVRHFTTVTALHNVCMLMTSYIITQSFCYRKSVLEFWVIWPVSMTHVYLSARTLTYGNSLLTSE